MGGRWLGNLREALGALGRSGEYEGTLGYVPLLEPPPLRNLQLLDPSDFSFSSHWLHSRGFLGLTCDTAYGLRAW